MSKKIISREAGKSGKGQRLQLIRAIVLMLNSIEKDTNSVFFTAIENLEDVSHQTFSEGQANEYFEEDKNYDLTGNFTIFSPPVTNTLVSFFDIYIDKFQSSRNLYLGFYTTREIGKERKTKLNDETELELPNEPILELLQKTNHPDIAIAKTVKDILVEEYRSQYNAIKGNGNLQTLINISENDFCEFLSRIIWHFGQEDATELKSTALNCIENSPLHNNAHIGKEHLIFSQLMEKLGEFQDSNDLIDKLVSGSDVKLIFKDVESQPVNISIDPTWKSIMEAEKLVTDKRNLIEKVDAVIEDLSKKRIASLARKAGASKYEELQGDKTFQSLKYRVLEACEEYFDKEGSTTPVSMYELSNTREALIAKAMEDILVLKNDYQYTISNEKSIEGIIWNLFDCCFLAFDEDVT